MNIDAQKLVLNGKEYVPVDSVNLPLAQACDGLKYVIIRTYSAGVFAGYLESRSGKEVVLRQVRRLWCWYGAASLSQLAVDGTSLPKKCKFPCEVAEITLTEAIEVIACTEKAMKSIKDVPIWTA